MTHDADVGEKPKSDSMMEVPKATSATTCAATCTGHERVTLADSIDLAFKRMEMIEGSFPFRKTRRFLAA